MGFEPTFPLSWQRRDLNPGSPTYEDGEDDRTPPRCSKWHTPRANVGLTVALTPLRSVPALGKGLTFAYFAACAVADCSESTAMHSFYPPSTPEA